MIADVRSELRAVPRLASASPAAFLEDRAAAAGAPGRLVPLCFAAADRHLAERLLVALGQAMARTTGEPAIVLDGIRGEARTPAVVESAARALLRRGRHVIVPVPVAATPRFERVLSLAPHVVALGEAAADAARAFAPAGAVIEFQPTRGAERRTVGEQRAVEARRGGLVYGEALDGAGASSIASSHRGVDALARRLTGRRIGIALGAGSTRAFAHIGVLERLEELGLPVDVVAGSSAGAGIAGMWGMGRGGDWMAARFGECRAHALRPAFSRHALLSGAGLERHFRDTLGAAGFDGMRRPLGVVAVDLAGGAPHVFTRGDLARAVLASCAVPGIFPAVPIGDRCFVDGGVSRPVPVDACVALGADRVIAVDLAPAPPARRSGERASAWSALVGSLDVLFDHVRHASTASADLVIRPVAGTRKAPGMFDFRAAAGLRATGRAAVDALLPELRARFPELRGPAEAPCSAPPPALLH